MTKARIVAQVSFGRNGQYLLTSFEDRFGNRTFFVADTFVLDEYNLSKVVAQFDKWSDRPSWVREGLVNCLDTVTE